jgi:hypothetical protein
MGRCQGSFCTERIISLLAQELGLSASEILKDQSGSTMLTATVPYDISGGES